MVTPVKLVSLVPQPEQTNPCSAVSLPIVTVAELWFPPVRLAPPPLTPMLKRRMPCTPKKQEAGEPIPVQVAKLKSCVGASIELKPFQLCTEACVSPLP